jgi:hypothetical protein
MGFGWMRMFELDEKVLDVAVHTDATPTGCIVPFDVNTCKLVASHVELYPMELLENIAEMVEVFYPNILHPKVINHETELDGMPFVMPEAWGGFNLVMSLSNKVGLEEMVGKNAGLGKAITALANLKVDPSVTIVTLKFVLLNEFLQDISNLNADVLGVWHWSIEVEVLEVNGAEMCAWAREHAVEKKLDKFEGCGVGSHIAREADAIAANRYASANRIILFRTHFACHHGVADFLPFMAWDVMVVNKEEGVSARNPFCVGRRPRAYALVLPSKFIGVRRVPGGFVAGITTELAMFKKLASGGVEHQKSL